MGFLGDVLTCESTCEGGVGIDKQAGSSPDTASSSGEGSGVTSLAFPPIRNPLPLGLLTGGGDVAGSAGGPGEDGLVRCRV